MYQLLLLIKFIYANFGHSLHILIYFLGLLGVSYTQGEPNIAVVLSDTVFTVFLVLAIYVGFFLISTGCFLNYGLFCLKIIVFNIAKILYWNINNINVQCFLFLINQPELYIKKRKDTCCTCISIKHRQKSLNFEIFNLS